MSNYEGHGFRPDGLIYSAHPNPAWARRSWHSLDGKWKLEHEGRTEEITVPFPIGSEASGVDFGDSGEFLYSLEFDYEGFDGSKRYALHVGACDYEAEAFLNGTRLGSHRGGYASFSFDIAGDLRGKGNRLEIRVRDSHSAEQCRGKQTFRKDEWFVWYRGIAGIWQSVWIEETGAARLEKASVRGDFDSRRVLVSAAASGGAGLRLEAEVSSESGGSWVFEARASGDGQEGGGAAFELSFPFDAIGARPWSPESPNLYAIRYRLYSGRTLCDTVESYFGLRKIEARDNALWLNGGKLFLRMLLVQGYYPGGVYTPLSIGVLEKDIETMKAMGYNGARIHEKIESPYFHYLCDRMGLLTSFEMPSFYRSTARAREAYESEFREILSRDSMHPSSIIWVLFNETWGVWGIYRKRSKTRKFVEAMLALARKEDPDRLAIENSGWDHFDTDIVDFHHYLGTAALARELYARFAARDEKLLHGFAVRKVIDFYLRNTIAKETRSVFLDRKAEIGDRPLLLSEYGGFGWYSISEKGSTIEKIGTYTKDIVDSGVFCGYCLTQLYDVGHEVNGLLSFGREPKVDLAKMREINGR
jgi:hypothetical protein